MFRVNHYLFVRRDAMSRLKRLTAIIMAPVLGCTVLAAPGVAAAAEETTDLKMNCFIKQG